MTNKLLMAQNDFGDNRERLAENWQDWLNQNPFDADVAAKLVEIYERRISNLDRKKDAGEIQRINRKLFLAQGRANRYNYSEFK